MDTKPWYKSKAIIGSVVTTACLILMVFKVGVSPAEQEQVTDRIVQVVEAAGAFIGVALAIWGRIKAESKLTT